MFSLIYLTEGRFASVGFFSLQFKYNLKQITLKKFQSYFDILVIIYT